jgi:uncharacterized membrane protein YfcA
MSGRRRDRRHLLLVAIGGGVLSVPFMTWCNVKMQNAIGTSAAIGLPIALGGTLGYIWNGWGAPACRRAALVSSTCRRWCFILLSAC